MNSQYYSYYTKWWY